jgi:hypothetical protein
MKSSKPITSNQIKLFRNNVSFLDTKTEFRISSMCSSHCRKEIYLLHIRCRVMLYREIPVDTCCKYKTLTRHLGRVLCKYDLVKIYLNDFLNKTTF